MIDSLYILMYFIVHLQQQQYPYTMYRSYEYYDIALLSYLIQPSMIRTTVNHIETYLSNFFFSRVPLSQYKTCARTAVTIQNMYTYPCHNTKHVQVPLSQNMYTYRCHNTKHVHVSLSQYKIITKIWVTLISVTCFWFSRYSNQAVGSTVGLISLITLGRGGSKIDHGY